MLEHRPGIIDVLQRSHGLLAQARVVSEAIGVPDLDEIEVRLAHLRGRRLRVNGENAARFGFSHRQSRLATLTARAGTGSPAAGAATAPDCSAGPVV